MRLLRLFRKHREPECPAVFTAEFGRKLLKSWGEPTFLIDDGDCWVEFAVNYAHLRERFERYIEEATTGDPAYGAYALCRYFGSDREWAERVIKNAVTGDPSLAAAKMHFLLGSSKEWCEDVEKRIEIRKLDADISSSPGTM